MSANPNEKLSFYTKLRLRLQRNRDSVVAYSFLTPMVIYFVLMTFVPLFFLLAVSLTQWNVVSWPPVFVGLKNISRIFSSWSDWFYLRVIGRTILYAIAILTLNVGGGFLIALVMNQNLPGKGVFRTLWYLPAVFSGAVIARLMRIFLAPSRQGILNMVLLNMGIEGFEPVNWITSEFWMPIIAVIFVVWQGIGWTVIFFLAGLQGIDENLYDAAKIDGAGNLQLMWYITIPQMIPIFVFLSVTGLVGSMQMWEVPLIISAGGPNDLTYTLVYSIYNDAFGNLDWGMGTAQSLVLFVLLLIFIGWQLNQYRKQYQI